MSDKGMLEIIAEMRQKPLCVLLSEDIKHAMINKYKNTTLGKFLKDWEDHISLLRIWIQMDSSTPTFRIAKTIYNKGLAYDMTFAFDGSFLSGDKELLKYIAPELFASATAKILAKGQKQHVSESKER